MKIEFTNIEIDKIKNLYLINNLSTREIAKIFNISNTPIKRILKNNKILRKSNGDGIKLILSDEQRIAIKNLYLNDNKNSEEIGKLVGCSEGYINKYLTINKIIRTRSQATKLSVTGRKVSQRGIENMKRGQKNLVLSGNRIQTGGICKTFFIGGLKCQGTYEKSYIECLINNSMCLPQEGKLVITPYGGYYPDFQYENKLIEIKSPYTYDVLLGNKKSRWTKQFEYKQLQKIKWVNENIMPVDIVIVSKNNIKEIKSI